MIARASHPILVIFLLVISSPLATAQDLVQDLRDGMKVVQTSMPDGEALEFVQFIAFNDVPPAMMGHVLFARRHFDKAAWFFGAGAQVDPSNPANLNNFAAMLMELNADDNAKFPDAVLQTAVRISAAAIEIDPTNAAFHHTQARIIETLVNRNHGDFDVSAAITAAVRATELAPEDPHYWATLARIYGNAGQDDKAKAALAVAAELDPVSPSYAVVANQLNVPFTPNPMVEEGPSCAINFKCAEICPVGIIGGLKRVTCELENATAVQLCKEGKDFPTSYDCDEEFPRFGIQLPGLNSGFSVCVPGFCVHVKTNGKGEVDVRVEAGPSMGPAEAYAKVEGHYSPDSGVSVDRVGGGVRVKVYAKSPVAKVAARHGQPPLTIEAESAGGEPVTLGPEIFNAGVIVN